MGWLSKKWKQIKGWFTPSEPKPQGINIEKKGTNQGVPIIYGFMKKSPCVKVLKVTTDKSGGAINEYLHFICVFCVGEIEEIGQLYFNDIPQGQIDNERYYIEKFVGSETQTYCTELAAEFSRWKSTAKLKNVAYAYVRLTQNKNIDWWRGEPSIAADIKGLKVLDPRDNQVKYSDNLALCTYDYLTNADYGKGLAASKVNTQTFNDAADFIDTERTYTRTIYQTGFDDTYYAWSKFVVGTENETVIESLMSCNVSLDPEKTLKKNVETLLGGMRAILPETNGQYRIAIEKDDAPAFAFTKDNLVGAIQCQGGSQSDRYNQVIIRFRNVLTGEDDEAVFPDDDALHQTWKDEDNGKLLLGEFDFDTINNKAEALQMGHVIAYRSRELLGALFTGTPETIVVEAGDVVTLPSQIFGWIAKPFRIESVDIDLETGEIGFQAVEHQNTIYPWAIGDVTEEFADTSFALPSSIEPPTGLAFTPTDDVLSLGKLTWDDANNVMVTKYIVTLKKGGVIVASSDETTPFFQIRNVGGGDFTAEVAAANALYTSAIALLSFVIEAPINPDSINAIVTNNAITVRPEITAGIPPGVSFEIAFSSTNVLDNAKNRGVAREFTVQHLKPITLYYFWARSVSDAGFSSWLSGSATTTNSKTEILEVFGGSIGQEDLNEATQDLLKQVDREQPNNLPDRLDALSFQSNAEALKQQDIERALFDTTSKALTYQYEQAKKTNALVIVDPETGLIVNRAFSYTDESYSQAQVLINGVDSRVTIEATRSTATEQRLTLAEADIEVSAGAIALRATYSEVSSEIGQAIDAITPAYSFQFNTSADGWNGCAWNTAGYITITEAATASITNLSFSADENHSIQLRVKNNTDTDAVMSWNGGNQRLKMSASGVAVADVWEIKSRILTAADGWSGTITSIEIETLTAKTLDIDYIVLGKPSANQTSLNDLTFRATTIEQDINAKTGMMATYAKTAEVTALGYQTDKNVNELIDTFNSTWQVSATWQEFYGKINTGTTDEPVWQDDPDNVGALAKAGAAQLWIDSANTTIRNQVINYNAEEGGIDEQVNAAQTEINAAKGKIVSQVASIQGLELTDKANNIDDVINAYNAFLSTDQSERQAVDISYVKRESKANTEKHIAVASEALTIAAKVDSSAADIVNINKAVANSQSALATAQQTLTAAIDKGDNAAIAQANEYTRTAIGYCVDSAGNITSDEGAVLCVATPGNSWVDGPLAEFIRNLQISKGENTASLTDIRQVFETKDGKLIARGGMVSDVDGRISGFLNHNDGVETGLDFISDNVRFLKPETFEQAFHWDADNDTFVFSGTILIQDTEGNKILDKAGMDWAKMGGTKKPADNATNTTKTSQLTDDSKLGNTADWPSVGGTGKPADNATNTTKTSQLTDDSKLGENALWASVGGTGKPANNATKNTGALANKNTVNTAEINLNAVTTPTGFSSFNNTFTEDEYNNAAKVDSIYAEIAQFEITRANTYSAPLLFNLNLLSRHKTLILSSSPDSVDSVQLRITVKDANGALKYGVTIPDVKISDAARYSWNSPYISTLFSLKTVAFSGNAKISIGFYQQDVYVASSVHHWPVDFTVTGSALDAKR